jgi:prepilin-type N-terminal cleavage/methylation domain-containing protein
MKTQSGFTLVELMIVVVLIGIILAMVTLNFGRLNEKYTVESNIKELYSLLMRARNDAATTNIPRFVVIGANQVQIGRDTVGDNVMDTVDNTITYPRFTLNGNTVVFDRRGLTNNKQTLSISDFSAGTTPAMDCIVVAFTRINIGKMTGENTCVQR